MSKFINQLVKEMDGEANTTRKMLERVPAEKFDWRPHPKSMTLRELSVHVGELPSWVAMALNTNELDFASAPYTQVPVANNGELLAYYEKSLADGRSELLKADENKFDETWTLRNGDDIYWKGTKYEMIRVAFSQTVHHRAQLGVYLRLLNIPIPGSYGPSADETSF